MLNAVFDSSFVVENGRQFLYQIQMEKQAALCLLFLLAGGCKQMQPILSQAGYTHSLGEFKVERVTFVQKTPTPGDGYNGGGFLKLELASSRQLLEEYPTYWLGVASDYCPLTDDHHLIALAAFDQDGSYFGKSPPVKQSPDGKYRYQIYLVRAYPPPGKTHNDYGSPRSGPYAQSEYDIVEDEKDLCLQIFGGDHYNVFARSTVIRVNHAAILNAAIKAQTREVF
jgi:hypothetical protein